MLKLDWNLVFTVINILIFYFCIKKLLFGPITNIMDQRQSMIKEQLESAGRVETDALAKKTQYDNILSRVKEEADQILEKARAEAKAEYDKVVMAANQESGKILKEARSAITADRERAFRDIQAQVAVLAAMAAEKLLIGQKMMAAGNGRMYDQFVKGIGEGHDTDGN